MKKITLPIKKDEWLVKALKRKNDELRNKNVQIKSCKDIPPNVVFNKTLCGIGATYTEIKAKRNSIIIEPNVPVIIGKSRQHSFIQPVFDDIKAPEIRRYFLNDSIRYKKFVTTPEGFSKIKEVAQEPELNIQLYEDYFCLFDECEKITEDVGYRDKITLPIYDFLKFKDKALVSATPLHISHPEIRKQFRMLEVVPDYDYKQDIEVIVTNHFSKCFEEQIKNFKDSECVCIFYSSTQGINRIINNTIKSDYKVYCSAKSARILRNLGIENVSSDFDTELAKYNFFTSRFFSALDINLRVRPDIIICTDIYEKEHTVIDPFTEAIQIQGRFRQVINGKRYNSITHITNIKENLLGREENSILNELSYYREDYEEKLKQLSHENDVDRRRGIEKAIKKSPYYNLLDYRNNINDFAVDNWIAEERVNRYYTSKEELEQAYRDTNFYIPLLRRINYNLSQVDSYSISKARSGKAIIEEMVSTMVKLNDIGAIKSYQNSVRHDEGYLKQSKKYKVDTDIVVEAYFAMGSIMFEQVNYNFKKVKEKLEVWKQCERRKNKDVLLDIFNEIEINKPIDRDFIKAKLQEIYQFYEITHNSCKVTHETMKLYFNKIIPRNSKRPYTITLKELKPEFEKYYNIFLADIATNVNTEPEQEETAKFIIPGNVT